MSWQAFRGLRLLVGSRGIILMTLIRCQERRPCNLFSKALTVRRTVTLDRCPNMRNFSEYPIDDLR